MTMNISPASTFLRRSMRRSGCSCAVGGLSVLIGSHPSPSADHEVADDVAADDAAGGCGSDHSVSIFTALVIVCQDLISFASQVRASSSDFEGEMMKPCLVSAAL